MNNSWLVFALIAPVFLSFSDVITKKLNHTFDEYACAWFRNLFSLPVFIILLISSGIPQINPRFWLVLVLIMPVEITVTLIYFRSIKVSPISVTAPFGAFHPILISLGAFIILGETIRSNLLLPIFLLVFGAYLINIRIGKSFDLFEPFKSFGVEKGPVLMLLSGFLFAITVPVGKLLVGYSSPQFYTLAYFTLSTILFTPIFLKKTKNSFSEVKSNIGWILIMGLFNGLFLMTSWFAYSAGPEGVVASLNKLTIIITILLAGLHLKEKEIWEKVIASLFMIAGAVLVVLFS